MAAITAATLPPVTSDSIPPMGWRSSLLHFGLPALALVVAFHGLMPWLVSQGLTWFYAYCLALALPLTAMLVAAVVATRAEGGPLTGAALRERWRFHALGWRGLLAVVAAFVGSFVAYGALGAVQRGLATAGLLPVPDGLPPFLDPRATVGAENVDQLFGPIQDNWPVLLVFVALLVVNIVGEELWWRGYVLPRQERYFGRGTWLVHGLMWNCFHLFKWWDLLALLPVTLILSYLVVRQRNSTGGLVLHALFNGMGIFPLLLGILGTGR